MSLFVYDIIIDIGNLMESTKKLLELLSEFGKVEEYKINIQKLILLVYASNIQMEAEI